MGTTWSNGDDSDSDSSAPASPSTTTGNRITPLQEQETQKQQQQLCSTRKSLRQSERRIRKNAAEFKQIEEAAEERTEKSPPSPRSISTKRNNQNQKRLLTLDDCSPEPPQPEKKVRRQQQTVTTTATKQQQQQRKVFGNFDTLVHFHQTHGHCRVPQNEEYVNLAVWCYTQKRRREGYGAQLTPTEIARLDKLGFNWHYTKKKGRRSFDDMCRELEAFQAQYNHCRVPKKGEWLHLAEWVYCMQRRRVAVYKRCRKLTPGQIERLESLGLEWRYLKQSGSGDEVEDDRGSSSEAYV